MRIMIFNTLYYPFRIGGAEVSVQILAEELVRQGNDVRVITLHDKKEREEILLNGVEVVYLPLKNVYWPFSNNKKSPFKKLLWHTLDNYNYLMYKKSLLEIDKYQPDVVHTNNLAGFSVAVWHAVKKSGVKLVHSSRDYYLFHPNCTLFKSGENMDVGEKSVFLWSWLKKKISNNVDSYVGISKYISNVHAQNGFFSNSKKQFIYNPVEKIKSFTNEEVITVGFIGRLTLEKGFDEFCRIAAFYKNNDKFKFVAAGEYVNNGSRDLLEKLASDSNVQIKGYMPLKEFLNMVKVVILPIKWNEPFGRTAVECALSEKIVFTNSVGAMTELSDIMSNIVLISNGEVNILDKVEEMIPVQLHQNIEINFAPRKIANDYLSVYRNK